MNLTLPADLIWTVAVTPLEEQLPQPTKAPPQPIPILKCVQSPARASHHPSAAPDTRGLDVCARSRVIVSNHAAKAALRERRGTHEAAHRVVTHVPSAPPELRVMMSIPTIFNPNLNGMEPNPDFLPSPNETVGFKCAPLPSRPDCPRHRATSQRCPRGALHLTPPCLLAAWLHPVCLPPPF